MSTERVLTVLGNQATRPITDFALLARGNGNVFYVSSDDGDDGRSGRSPETAVATLDYAIGLCTANQGDVIYVLPSHTETIATASGVDVDVAGITIIGLGEGADRPTFTFSAVDATMTVDAASCVVKNLLIKPSIDSVVSPIVVSAANCSIDVEIQDATSLIECVSGILTTAAADNLDIKLKYRGFLAGNACVSPIKLVGVDTARIYVDFYGVASTAIVEFHTTSCHDIDITGLFYNNGTTLTKNVVDTVGSSTWSVRGWDGNSNAQFSGGDNAALATDDVTALATAIGVIDAFHDVPTANVATNAQVRDVVGNKTDAAVGAVTTDKSVMGYVKGILEDTGTTIPGTILALPKCIEKSDGIVANNTTDDLFTITGGPVRCKIVGLVTTIIGGAANMKLQHTTVAPAATVELNAGAVAIDADAVGTLYQNIGATSVFTPSDTLGVEITDPVTIEEVEFILTPGTVKAHASATQTGNIKWYMTYTPMSPSSVVTAAA